ncbi:nuclear transport factor 2 family protein [Ruicaihuangia caeni]|uniref:nuclear transport factor 2 family protein n=1 Tax=Ruicaihuangia caeni TaxID=3042517 RepID=UPI00338D896E
MREHSEFEQNTGRGAVDQATRHEIADLVAEFNWKLDAGRPEGFAALFTEDGVFAAAGKEHRGGEALQAFADARTAQDKLSRTFFGQHQLRRVSDDEIEGVLPNILFMGPGQAPRTPDVFAVAEYHDTYRRVDGRWLIAERRSVQVFSRPKP